MCIQWMEFMEFGKDVEQRVVEEKMKSQRANQCAAVVFSVYQSLFSIIAMPCYIGIRSILILL